MDSKTMVKEFPLSAVRSVPGAALGAVAVALAAACLLPAVSATAQEIIELPGEDRILEIEFEELYRLGTPAGEDWEQFGHVQSVAFDPAGNLLVFDRTGFQVHGIFLVGPEGRLIRKVGQPGEGPGEYGEAVSAAVMTDGRVVISDLKRRGYHVFGADGEFGRLVRMPGSPSAWRMGLIRAQPGADAIISVPAQATAITMTARATRGPIVLPTSLSIERTILSGEWSATDTIAEAWLPPSGIEDEDESTQRNLMHRPTSELPEFSASLHWGVLPDGRVAFADSTTWTVKIAEAGSGVVRILKRPFQPEPMTGRDIRAEKDRRRRSLGETGRSSEDLRRRRARIENAEFADEIPVILNLGVTWDGRMWVLRRGEGRLSEGVMDVVAADGRYIGSYPAGATAMPDAFGPDGLVAIVERNELGVQTVVVGRVG